MMILGRLAPFLFIFIWSTGFVVARWAVPHGSANLILLARMTLTAICFAGAALAVRQPWPHGRRLTLHLVAGALLIGVYLCASWWAVGQGMPAGVMALLGALQPLLVAVGSTLFLRERLSAPGWVGLGVGFLGVVLVLQPLLASHSAAPLSPIVLGAAAVAIVAMAAGTMVQSGSIARDGILVAGATQNAGGVLVALVAAGMQGDTRWDDSAPLFAALGWSVVVLSLAGLSLLVWMTRHQGATRVSVLLLMVPPLAAFEAHLLFAEQLSPLQFVGFVLALTGVILARRSRRGGSADQLRPDDRAGAAWEP